MARSETYTEKFEKNYEGVNYSCLKRVTVSVNGELRQTVFVDEIGNKSDPAFYGKNGHPVESMEGIAHLIAIEIIKSNLSKN